VVPFGLTCAPSVFQRLMDLVPSGLLYQSCLVYLDDVIVLEHSLDETMDRLEKVFERLQRAGQAKAKTLQGFAFPEVCGISWPRRIRSRHCYARGQDRCHSGLAFVPNFGTKLTITRPP